MPERVRLSRKKGWRKPENTVVVSRPSRWGNPFWITREACDESTDDGYCWVVRPYDRRFDVAHAQTESEARASAVDEYKVWVMYGRTAYNPHQVKAELRGKNLACWCPLDQPCHADVLLEIANRDD
ncbi:DUF4326 domain-containing protein [Microbacterium sp. Leaf320]|uniref:DUF4326 domain-containing protein n=1 Tax=Microbacterium sp. Leaf320 TaxID=1736334 RepID=UPI0009EA3B03|nr:DUF4326 domain-containing protein [Microbacterium sp. Leaf320]